MTVIDKIDLTSKGVIPFMKFASNLALQNLHCAPRTHNQVFVDTLSLVHSLRTVAALDDGNYSLLQLVCGGLLDSSVSPAWDGEQVKQG